VAGGWWLVGVAVGGLAVSWPVNMSVMTPTHLSGSDSAMPLTLEEVRALPKVLLHDHLDGGLRPQTILDLADECGWTPRLPTTDLNALQAWFTRGADSRDILQYLATFEHTLAVMQTESGIERVAFEAAQDLAADGVRYAEIRFAPELHQQQGLALEAIVEAVQSGFRRGSAAARSAGHTITINTIVCAMRTEQRSLEIATLAVRMRAQDDRVVAFDLAGAETGWPPSLHLEALEYIRRNQMHLTIHASEPPDLELITDALALGAERIGHGVRLLADMTNVDFMTGTAEMGPVARYILERQVPLELAPTCNVQIGAVPSLDRHAIGPFLRAGFRVNINTDNRLMSNVSVSSEVHAVAQAFGFNRSEVARVALNGIDASFSSWGERRAIRKEIEQAYS
jgi:adenosine deaminase